MIMENFLTKRIMETLLLILLTLIFSDAQAVSKQLTKEQWQDATSAVVKKYEPAVDAELIPYFHRVNVTYPPKKIALLTFKKEKDIELWAQDTKTRWKFIRSYPLMASSGSSGPKLHMNDNQIPEGIYKVVELNPFSSQHLSMMINYPNEFDRAYAKEDGRTNLGDNIFIHGKNLSVGCIAVGDDAIEDLFVLLRTGKPGVSRLLKQKHARKNHSY